MDQRLVNRADREDSSGLSECDVWTTTFKNPKKCLETFCLIHRKIGSNTLSSFYIVIHLRLLRMEQCAAHRCLSRGLNISGSFLYFPDVVSHPVWCFSCWVNGSQSENRYSSKLLRQTDREQLECPSLFPAYIFSQNHCLFCAWPCLLLQPFSSSQYHSAPKRCSLFSCTHFFSSTSQLQSSLQDSLCSLSLSPSCFHQTSAVFPGRVLFRAD